MIQLPVAPDTTFVELLRESGLHFTETPELDVRKPSSPFKLRGARLRVDLLVPGDACCRTVRVSEPGAHATALP